MTALLKFECRAPVDGYKILSFDQRKLVNLELAYDDDVILPPPNFTEDERYLLNRWRGTLRPWGDPEVKYLFERKSERIRCFDLFEETEAPFLEFTNSPTTLEGAKALADRVGPLNGGLSPEYVGDWYGSIRELRGTVLAWEKAKATGDFSRIIRTVERQTARLRSFDKGGPMPGIDASILLSKDPLSGEARLCIRPSTLSDALWTQLALAIDGSQSLQTCVECKKWFAIKSDRGRSDKEYCSDACRMRAYRKRKKDAQ